MTRLTTLLAIALAAFQTSILSAQTVHSVLACPSEDTEDSMKISWNSDISGTYVVFSPAEGGKGAAQIKVTPETESLCTAYDGVPSRDAAGVNFDQNVKFLKCGATLSGLRKNTEYIYYICSSDGQRLSTNHRFKTSGSRRWTAAVISDFHHYTPIPARLASAMDMVRTLEDHDRSTDWVLHLGDVAAWGGSYEFWRTLYREDLFSRYFVAGLNGNHDNMTRTGGQSGDFFRYANYLPQNGYGDQMGICYHFRYNDALFIMLNNEVMKTDEGLAEAREWVRRTVTDSRSSANPPRYVIVCEHYQWFYGKDGAFSQFSRWNDLFDELGVDLALGANNHIYVRSNPIHNGKTVSPKDGTVYIQTSSSDNERGEEMDPALSSNQDLIAARWTEGGQTISGVSLDVTPRRMTLTLLDRYGNIVDKAVIPAKNKRRQQ